MQIIDCFCGLGRWRSRDKLLPYEPQEILKLMDHFGIARALVFSNMGAEHGPLAQSNQVVADAAAQSDRFIPAFILAPPTPAEPRSTEQVTAELRLGGARAAWMWPQTGRQGHGLHQWLVGDLLDLCVQHRLPLFLYIEGIEPDTIHRVCTDFPALRLVVTGIGYAADQWLFPLLRQHENVYVSLGHFYIPASGPRTFIDTFGDERLLFGSGLPHFSPGGVIAHVMYAAIPDGSKEKLLGGNLERLLSEVKL